MQTIDTPCRKICTLHPRLHLCLGCGRTIEEIGRWLALSPEDRIAIMNMARQRLSALPETGS